MPSYGMSESEDRAARLALVDNLYHKFLPQARDTLARDLLFLWRETQREELMQPRGERSTRDAPKIIELFERYTNGRMGEAEVAQLRELIPKDLFKPKATVRPREKRASRRTRPRRRA